MTVGIVSRVKDWAQRLKRDIVALWFACQHDRMPRGAKALAIFTVSYALSPIDLIPDFIPVLGFVDDAVILPGLIWLLLRMIPADVMTDCRSKAVQWLAAGSARPVSRVGAVAIVILWLLVAAWLWMWFGKTWL